MKKGISIIVTWFFMQLSIGAEQVQTFADICEEIRQGLGEGKMEIDTSAGRYIHHSCNHGVKLDDPQDPDLGPSITELNDKTRKVIRAWIGEKQPKWVAIIVPADSPASDFIELCSILRELGVGYTTFSSEGIEGRKFTRLTLIRGNYTALRFTKRQIDLPMHKPIAPKRFNGPWRSTEKASK